VELECRLGAAEEERDGLQASLRDHEAPWDAWCVGMEQVQPLLGSRVDALAIETAVRDYAGAEPARRVSQVHSMLLHPLWAPVARALVRAVDGGRGRDATSPVPEESLAAVDLEGSMFHYRSPRGPAMPNREDISFEDLGSVSLPQSLPPTARPYGLSARGSGREDPWRDDSRGIQRNATRDQSWRGDGFADLPLRGTHVDEEEQRDAAALWGPPSPVPSGRGRSRDSAASGQESVLASVISGLRAELSELREAVQAKANQSQTVDDSGISPRPPSTPISASSQHPQSFSTPSCSAARVAELERALVRAGEERDAVMRANNRLRAAARHTQDLLGAPEPAYAGSAGAGGEGGLGAEYATMVESMVDQAMRDGFDTHPSPTPSRVRFGGERVMGSGSGVTTPGQGSRPGRTSATPTTTPAPKSAQSQSALTVTPAPTTTGTRASDRATESQLQAARRLQAKQEQRERLVAAKMEAKAEAVARLGLDRG
jgi:hypothetical protein